MPKDKNVLLPKKAMTVLQSFFKYLLLPFLINVASLDVSAQNLNKQVIPPSPEASSLGKYAEFTPSLYTGNPSINIPLYQLSYKNHVVPISLSYAGTGITVAEVASKVGLGWTMNAGGVISRSVKGLPDESGAGFFNTKGQLSPTSLSSSLNNQQYATLEAVAYGRFDSQPDMYTFNFLNYSGKFYFDDNNNIQFDTFQGIKVVSKPNYAITAIQSVVNDGWVLQAPDGIKYTFGYSNSSVEIANANVNDEYSISSFPTAWYLTKITYPDGDEANFTYNANANNSGSPGYTLTSQTVNITSPGDPCADSFSNGGFRSIYSTYSNVSLSQIDFPNATIIFNQNMPRQDLPGSKALSSFEIISKNTNQLINRFSFDYQDGPGSRLKLLSVVEHGTGHAERKYKFSYNEWLDIPYNSFSVDHYGFYNGASYNQNLIPDEFATGFNLWASSHNFLWANRKSDPIKMKYGSLNRIDYPTGGYSVFDFEPNQILGTTTTTPVSVSARLDNATANSASESAVFNIDHTQIVNLEVNYRYDEMQGAEAQGAYAYLIDTDHNNTIYQFTAGQPLEGQGGTSITIQPGHYKLKVANTMFNNTFIAIQTSYVGIQEGIEYVGGLRIKRITDYNLFGQPAVRRFEYEKPYLYQPFNDNNYMYDYTTVQRNGPCNEPSPSLTCHTAVITSSNNISYGAWGSDIIGYGKVTTLFGDNGENGKEISYFSKQIGGTGGGFPYAPSTIYYGTGGLLTQKEYYSAQNILQKRETNTYESIEYASGHGYKAGFLKDDPCFDAASQGRVYDVITYPVYTVSSQWIKQVTSQEVIYTNSDTVVSLKRFFYDNSNHKQVTREEVKNSEGSTLVNIKSYAGDYAPGEQFIDDMMTQNIINVPIEQVNYTIENGISSIVSGAITSYKPAGKNLIDKIYQVETPSVVPLSSFKFSNTNTGQVPYNSTKSTYAIDSQYREKLSYDTYDTKGNPKQITLKDGISKTYLWGYNYQYPVAEIKNATYQQVLNVLGQGAIDQLNNNPGSDQNIRYILSLLRTSPTLKDAQMTTYTYSPLVGMTSSTDAKGETTYYEYDSFQRLKNVKDSKGNIIKQTDYHYQNQ